MAIEYRQSDVPRGVGETAVGFIRHISWGALFAGIMVAIASQVTLTLLGIGIGLAVVNPGEQQSPTAMAVGAGLWWLITGLVSLFIGGWVSARVSGSIRKSEGALHGLATWAAAAVFSLLLMTTGVAGLIGGSANMLGHYAGGQQAQGRSPDQLMDEAREQLGDLTGRQPRAPGERTVTRDDVKSAKDNAARAALWAFFAMLLGCGAAIGGGVTGAPHPRRSAAVSAEEEQRRRAA